MKIALIAPNGRPVTAEGGGNDDGLLIANRDNIAIWETFTVFQNGDGSYSFQSNRDDGKWGRFICAELGGGAEVHCNRALNDDPDPEIPWHLRTAIGVWESFDVIGDFTDGGGIALKCFDDTHFLGVGQDGVVDAFRETLQTFTVKVLEGGTNPNPGQEPKGIVRTSGRMMLDDNGPKHFLSTTLFWSAWGYTHDHDRWLQNVQYAKSKGCDGIRTLGSVMGPSWANKIDPLAPNYEQELGGMIDEAFSNGLRQFPFTMLGDELTDIHRATDRMISVMRGREEKIGYVEIANEWGHAVNISEADLMTIARKVRAAFPNMLLALSRPKEGDAPAMIARMKQIGGPLVLPRHTARQENDRNWRQVRQAYDFQGDPFTGSNQEPPGPASSVGELWKPRQLGMMRWLSHAAGCGVFVFHTGNGIRGINDPAHNRQPNLWEVSGIDGMWDALHKVAKLLPEGVQNWKLVNNGPSRQHPLSLPRDIGDGFWEGNGDIVKGDVNKNYAVLGPNGQFVSGIFGLNEGQERRSGQALYNMNVTAIDSLTEAEVKSIPLAGGFWLTLPGRRDREISYILVGQRR